MGKFSKSLHNMIVCGKAPSSRYQKFIEDDAKAYYDCEQCGHHGSANKVGPPQKLNNSNRVQSIAFRRSTSDLLKVTDKSNSANVTCLVNDLGGHENHEENSEEKIMRGLHMLGFCNGSKTLTQQPAISPHNSDNSDHITSVCRGVESLTVPVRSGCVNVPFEEEEPALRSAPWYQPGLSREIATEVLSSKSIGSFLVRSSESRPDSFALSLKVPNQSIVHYFIMSSSYGWKLKGSHKTFPSLTSLIVHHSVMSELLPCTLNLNAVQCSSKGKRVIRDDEEEFTGHSSDVDDDFEDLLDLSDYPDLLFTLRKAFGSSAAEIAGAEMSPQAMSDNSSTSSSI